MRVVNIIVPIVVLVLALIVSGAIFVWMRRHAKSWRNFGFVGKKREEDDEEEVERGEKEGQKDGDARLGEEGRGSQGKHGKL